MATDINAPKKDNECHGGIIEKDGWRLCDSMADVSHDDISNSPFPCLALSLIPLSLAMYGTFTGTAVLKWGKVHRSENPFRYWLWLAIEYALFAVLFGLFIVG